MIEDLGSRNGTFVNGRRIEGAKVVGAGDVITLSASTVTLSEGDDEGWLGAASVIRPATELVQHSTHLAPPEGSDAAASLQRQAERLAILNEVHRTLASSIDLDELLDTILDLLFEQLRPERGMILLKGSDERLEPAASRPRGISEDEIVFSRSLIREVVDKGMAALVHDVGSDARFAEARSLVDAGVRSLVAAPLADPRGTLGMIALSSSADIRVFTEDDLELLSSLASVAALRIRNLALAEEAAERRRLEHEVALARQIQRTLIPDQLPTVAGYHIYGGNEPSQGVSGDYYEVLERSDGAECVLLIADVCGKGIAASLLTAYIEALATPPIEDGMAPDQIFERVSRRLYERTPHERFATAFLAILDPARGVIRYANAGHNPALLLRSNDTAEWFRSTGVPLGLLPDSSYGIHEIELAVGDLLVLYTDGITEAANPEEDEYGTQGLECSVRSHRDLPLDELAQAIERDLERFAEGTPFADDRTLVMLRRTA
jgi:serine phosphatase RsbU (regulator of sigma subunit)